jgi:hypothetical protein
VSDYDIKDIVDLLNDNDRNYGSGLFADELELMELNGFDFSVYINNVNAIVESEYPELYEKSNDPSDFDRQIYYDLKNYFRSKNNLSIIDNNTEHKLQPRIPLSGDRPKPYKEPITKMVQIDKQTETLILKKFAELYPDISKYASFLNSYLASNPDKTNLIYGTVINSAIYEIAEDLVKLNPGEMIKPSDLDRLKKIIEN